MSEDKIAYKLNMVLTEQNDYDLVNLECYFLDKAKLKEDIPYEKVIEFLEILKKSITYDENTFFQKHKNTKQKALELFSHKHNFYRVRKEDFGFGSTYGKIFSLEDLIDKILKRIFHAFYNQNTRIKTKPKENIGQLVFNFVYDMILAYRNEINWKKHKIVSDYFVRALSGYITHKVESPIMSPTIEKVKVYFDKSQTLYKNYQKLKKAS